VAEALADVDHDRAASLATDAKKSAQSISDQSEQANALATVARALAEVAKHLNGPDGWESAVQAARSVSDAEAQVWALTVVAEALADVDHDRAASLAADAERTAHSVADYSERARAVAAVAKLLAKIDQARAAALVADAEQTVRSIANRSEQAWALRSLAEALADVGHWESAEQIAQAITDPHVKVMAYQAVASALAAASKLEPVGEGEALHGRACRLLARILAEEDWLEGIKLLGELNRSGIAAIYEALRSLKPEKGSGDTSGSGRVDLT